MGAVQFERVLDRHARRLPQVKHITLDLDVTDDATHGTQQLSFFNGHYGPLVLPAALGVPDLQPGAHQYLGAAALRPGNAPTQRGALPLLKRLLGRLQERFPQARILVRLDGGFACPELFEFLDEVGVDDVVEIAKNAVLERLVELDMITARMLSEQRGATAYVYGEACYAAHT